MNEVKIKWGNKSKSVRKCFSLFVVVWFYMYVCFFCIVLCGYEKILF